MPQHKCKTKPVKKAKNGGLTGAKLKASYAKKKTERMTTKPVKEKFGLK